jgi:hypothetical protein
MAALGKRFDATEHDTTQRDFEDLPNGKYRLEIEASEVVPGENGTGLKTTMVVIEPEQFKGRKLFGFYNLEHNSADAQRIGQQQFASLCRAIGMDGVEDSEELHFHAFMAYIALGKESTNKKTGKTYAARAEIKKYFFATDDQGNAIELPAPEIDANQPAPAANDNKPAARAAAPAASAAGRPAATGAKPWGKK